MSRIAAPMVGGTISSTVLALCVNPALRALVMQRQLRRENRQVDAEPGTAARLGPGPVSNP